ncbi:TetR-like C-terminal domain-containing protein [Micromonospora sp. NPDC050686]|uniref:TetR-like C-terminal domain-containing protein n=1 Tax=Micromonospora sp. NPDC050686 TaxID=3154631 RepID=UPI00340B34AD
MSSQRPRCGDPARPRQARCASGRTSPRRTAGAGMLRKAIERGELPNDLDIDLALDCLVGLTSARPQYFTASGELSDPYPRNRLVDVILTALAACHS